MEPLRICYALKLIGGGLWGSARHTLEADIPTIVCRHASGLELPCIPPTYMKGLLRRTLEEVVHKLVELGIVSSRDIVTKLFGPLTPMGEAAEALPSNTVIAPLYPIKSAEDARRLANLEPLSYLRSSEHLAAPSTYREPHVRLDDRRHSAAAGALYHELRVVPHTLFYGEVLHYPQSESEALDAARALLISLSLLNYRYVGRTTPARIAVIRVEPAKIAEDQLVAHVMKLRSIDELG